MQDTVLTVPQYPYVLDGPSDSADVPVFSFILPAISETRTQTRLRPTGKVTMVLMCCQCPFSMR